MFVEYIFLQCSKNIEVSERVQLLGDFRAAQALIANFLQQQEQDNKAALAKFQFVPSHVRVIVCVSVLVIAKIFQVQQLCKRQRNFYIYGL